MSRRAWIIFGLIIVLVIVGVIVGPTVAKFFDTETSTNNLVQSNWYNYSWLYREPITINNGGSALTNYQIQLTLNLSILISSSHMLANGNDIIFTSSDGQTVLPYWIQSISTPSAAIIWVKITSVPAGNSIIYMYYGNSAAAAASSGDNTFIFFDDFETTPFSKWTFASTGSGGSNSRVSTPTADHGTYEMSLTRAAAAGSYTATATFASSPTVAVVEFSARPNQTNALWEMQVLSSTSAIGPRLNLDASHRIRYNADLAFSPEQNYATGTWYEFKEDNVSASAGNYYLYINGSGPIHPSGANTYTPFNATITNINKITFFSSAPSSTLYVDIVKVRAYAATIPTLVSQGAEE